MGVYPRRIKLLNETQPSRTSLDIKIVLEPFLMGAGVVYRRPKMVYKENETKSSRS